MGRRALAAGSVRGAGLGPSSTRRPRGRLEQLDSVPRPGVYTGSWLIPFSNGHIKYLLARQ